MEEETRPKYPAALELFDPERATDIFQSLSTKKRTALELYASTLHEAKEPAQLLASPFAYPYQQTIPSLLRRLADYAEKRVNDPKRDHRPKTTNPKVRVFARELATCFEQCFGEIPWTVITAIIQLKFNLERPADEERIRDWCGKKK